MCESCPLKLNKNIKIEFVGSSDVIKIEFVDSGGVITDVIKIHDALLPKMKEIVGSYKGVPLTLKEFLLILTNEALFNSLILGKIEDKDIKDVKDVFEDCISFDNAIDAQIENWQHWGCLIPVNDSNLCQMSLIHHGNFNKLPETAKSKSGATIECPITRKNTRFHGGLQNLLAIVKILVDEQERAEKSTTSVKQDLTLKSIVKECGTLQNGLFDSKDRFVCGEVWSNNRDELITTRVDGHDFKRVADGVYRVNKIGENKLFYTSSLDQASKIEGVKRVNEYEVTFSKGVPTLISKDHKTMRIYYDDSQNNIFIFRNNNKQPSLAEFEVCYYPANYLDLITFDSDALEKIKGNCAFEIPIPIYSDGNKSGVTFLGNISNGKIHGNGTIDFLDTNQKIIGRFNSGVLESGKITDSKLGNTNVYRLPCGKCVSKSGNSWSVDEGFNCDLSKGFSFGKRYTGSLDCDISSHFQEKIGFSNFDGEINDGKISNGTLNFKNGSYYKGKFNELSFFDKGKLTIDNDTYTVLDRLQPQFSYKGLFFQVQSQRDSRIKIVSLDSSGPVCLEDQQDIFLKKKCDDGSEIQYCGTFREGDLHNGQLSFIAQPSVRISVKVTNGLCNGGRISLDIENSMSKDYSYKIEDNKLTYWSKENKKHIIDLSGEEVSRCLPISSKRKWRESKIREMFKRAKDTFGLKTQSSNPYATAQLGFA